LVDAWKWLRADFGYNMMKDERTWGRDKNIIGTVMHN
jgi:hypothetical protein